MTADPPRRPDPRLADQARLLVRAEQRLLHAQRHGERQLHRLRALDEFTLSAPHCRSGLELLRALLELAFGIFSGQAALAILAAPGSAAPARALLRTADDPARELSLPAHCRGTHLDLGELCSPMLLAPEEGRPLPAALLACLEELAPRSEWERTCARHSRLLLPVVAPDAGCRGLVLVRSAAGAVHDAVAEPADLPFLELVVRHASSAAEVIALQADLEARVAARTGELAAANERLEASLASLREAQTQLLQRVADLVHTREQLVQAEKAALAGRLAGMVAHEVNNPLAFMKADLELLAELGPRVHALGRAAREAATALAGSPEPEVRAHALALRDALQGAGAQGAGWTAELPDLVGEVLEGVHRIAELTRGLWTLAGTVHAPEAERIEVGEILARCLDELADPERRAVTLEPGQAPAAWFPEDDLRDAVRALLRFARGPSGARPTTVTLGEERGRPRLRILAAGLHLPEEERRQLLEPRVGSAGPRRVQLDLELALSERVLRRSGAELSTEDTPGGLTFQVLLPPAP